MKQFWGWLDNRDGQIMITAEPNQTEVPFETTEIIFEKSKIVGLFISYHMYFEMMIQNFFDVINIIEEFEQIEQVSKCEQDFIPYGYNVNRLFMNALGSIFAYINYYEKSRLDSVVSSNTVRLTSKYYDKYPLYRFLYKLRNFAVHVGLPITLLSTSAEKPNKEFYLDRDYLLENNDWGSKIVSDIKEFEENISVKNLSKEAIKLFITFHLELMSGQIDEIVEIQKYFDTFGRIIGCHIQYPVLLKIDDEDNKNVQIEDLFADIIVQVEHAFRLLGIDPHSGKVINSETPI